MDELKDGQIVFGPTVAKLRRRHLIDGETKGQSLYLALRDASALAKAGKWPGQKRTTRPEVDNGLGGLRRFSGQTGGKP